MRARAVVVVLVVGVAAAAGAAVAVALKPEAPAEKPAARPDAEAEERRPWLREWEDDAAAHAEDARLLDGELAQLPVPLHEAKGPDIVVIVLDTTRADHLGLYGYDKDTTPGLDAWAKQNARVYDRMVADGPWTIPSHGSLFTGRPPISHGAHGVPATSDLLASALAPNTPTVARALKAKGYATAGIVANLAFLGGEYGMDQGFDLWMAKQLPKDEHRLPKITADRVEAMAEELLAKRRKDQPVFLFLNFMEAHSPWVTRDGYVRDPDALVPQALPNAKGWRHAGERLMAEHQRDPRVIASWVEAYDGELRFLDEHVARLLRRLPELGIGDDDYVFVMGDHGEFLGEHDLVEHGKDVYDEVLRVPLLIKGPGYDPGRDATPIQHHDVASMILAAAGADALPNAEHTTDLQVSEQYWARQRDLKNPKIRHRFDRVRRAFRILDHKLIVGTDGSEEAYDLAADPDESSPLTDAPWMDELRARGKAWLDAHPAAPEVAPQKETDIAALRALGYVE